MKNRIRPLRPASLAALFTALLVGGCTSMCADETPPGSAGVPASDAAPADAAPQTAGELAPGEVQVVRNGDLVTVRANEASRMQIFGRIARAFGFTQHRGRLVGDPLTTSLDLEDVPVERAIASALGGLDFDIHYLSEGQAESRLIAVTVGEQTPTTMRDGARARRDARSRRSGSSSDPTELAARDRQRDEKRRQEEEERRRFVAENLGAGDERLRAEAVSRMSSGRDEELEKLKELLSSDPSSVVRREAAEALTSTDETAVGALINALRDPDPSVRKAAMDALEFSADEEHIPAILATGILGSSDPEERVQAVEMIEFLE